MKLANYEVPHLINVLFDLKLKSKESRMRSRFIRQLTDYVVNTLGKEEMDLLNEYGQKDENNELIPSEHGGFKLIEETQSDYHREFFTLQNEFHIIEENEVNKDMLLSVANSVLAYEDIVLEGEMASLWDKWCEQFEELIENYNKH